MTKFYAMSIKLRLLLLYLKYFTKDNLSIPPNKIREDNAKRQPTFHKILEFSPEELHEVRNEWIVMRDEQSIPVRTYRPSTQKNLPLIIYFHGGGFVLRNLDSHDRVCRRLSKMNNAVVVSVGYRLAPEYKFPTPHQDCYDATIWAISNTSNLGIDKNKVTVMGDSAGANLATVVSLIARDNNGPKISNQVLIYPCCDSSKTYDTEIEYSEGYFLTKKRMDWFTDHYVRKPEDVFEPFVSPVLMDDLSNLPRTFIMTAEYDPLKGEGLAYSNKLTAANNDVKYLEYSGVIHGFFSMPKISKECMEANQDIKSFLNYA